MFSEDAAARKRRVEAGNDETAVESDEQIARRLHDELNALTRHSRRAGPSSSGPSLQGKSGKPPAEQDGRQKNSQKHTLDVPERSRDAAVVQQAAAEQADFAEAGKSEKARKRSMLNRELAMLITDMVDSHVKPAVGPRAKLTEQQQQQWQQELHSSGATKHESSSSLSEQERLAIEQLHASGANGKLVNKLLTGSHLVSRTSDSGAAGDSSSTGATSSGNSSMHEQEQHQSHQHKQPTIQRHQQQRVSVSSARPGVSAGNADCAGSRPGKVPKIPKLPMVLYGKKWYRAKVLKDGGSRVMLEYQGYNHEGGPFWLNKDHARIWRGSYKGKDWRYLGEGAWEPKVPMQQEPKNRYRHKGHRKQSSAAAGTGSDATAAEDSDAEPLPQQKPQQQYQKQTGSAAAVETAAEKAEMEERDTCSADQAGEGQGDIDEQQQPTQRELPEAEPLTMDSPSMPETKQQILDLQPERAAEQGQVVPEVAEQKLVEEQQPDQPRQQETLHSKAQTAELAAEEGPLHVKPAQQSSEPAESKVKEQLRSHSISKQQSQESLGSQSKQHSKQQPPKQPEQNARQQSKQQSSGEGKQQSRRRRQNEPDNNDVADLVPAATHIPVVKQARRPGSARAADKVANTADATAASAAAPAAPGNSSSERAAGETGAAEKTDVADDKAEEVLSLPAVPAGRGGRTRSARVRSSSKRATGDSLLKAKRGRANRGRTVSAAAEAAQSQEPQQLHVPVPQLEVGKSLKNSSSSEAIPVSPTSPVAGGSPKAPGRRRKGKPQRARLDSDDLQQPVKKVKLCASSSRCNGLGFTYSQSDAADILEMSFEQAPPQPQPEPQQQQQQPPSVHLGWKGGWKGAYKKGIWHHSKEPQQRQKERYQSLACEERRQQPQDHKLEFEPSQQWEGQQQTHPGAADIAAGEGHMLAEQQPLLGGSEQEDVEAACVLVGASMDRTYSGEVFGMYDRHSYQHLPEYKCQPVSCGLNNQGSIGQANNRQNGRRRGHNWSKPTNRPPRPPPVQPLQYGNTVSRRTSINGSLQYAGRSGVEEQCDQGRSFSQECVFAAAASPKMSRQASVQQSLHAAMPQTGVAQHQQHQHSSHPSYLLFSQDVECKQATLRALLDAVGEVQARSSRPDLMYPLQFGGLPVDTRDVVPASLQLPHVQVSTAAALLAAVPSLETLQHLACVEQRPALVACLDGGGSPSLFQ